LEKMFLRISQAEVVCIIPTLNESTTVAEVVRKARQFAHRVIVVDGYSEDDTIKMACEAGAEIIFQDGKGKGMALRTVFSKIESDLYVIIDGDATYDAWEMEKVVRPILEGKADIVIGSRLRGVMEKGSISWLNRFGNRLFNLLINYLFNGQITDSQSGFRALNLKSVKNMNLSSTRFEIETEMTIQALKRGLKVKEVPITYVRRRGSLSKLNSYKAGLRILKTILKYTINNYDARAC
jgi:glycosyltransferase involved in cell wall biosynthesis